VNLRLFLLLFILAESSVADTLVLSKSVRDAFQHSDASLGKFHRIDDLVSCLRNFGNLDKDTRLILRPMSPAQLFESGAGSCQDRTASVLAWSRLKESKAWPVLRLRQGRRPHDDVGLDAFDHVFVRLETAGEWIDPTIPLTRHFGRWLLVCADRPYWVRYGR